MTTIIGNQDPHLFDVLHKVISSTLQKFYSNSINWDCEFDCEYDKLLDIYREFEENIENIPESIFKVHGELDTEKLTVFRDFLRLGIILYQSSFLNFSYDFERDWGSNFVSIPSETYLLTTIPFHLSKLNQTIQNLDYLQIIISHLKFEMFLVALLLKHPCSINIAFLAYRDVNCSETDKIFRDQIEDILTIEHDELHVHLRKMLQHVKSKRELLFSRLINDFWFLNEKVLFEALKTFYLASTPCTISDEFYNLCIAASINHVSNGDMNTHPNTVIDNLNHLLHNNSDVDCDGQTLIDNFLFAKLSCPDIPTEEANRVISKYVRDELNVSFSPEVDQGSSFVALIDFLMQLMNGPDEVISFLKLICSRVHPSIDFTKF